MPTPNQANTRSDVGVKRDPNASIAVNVESANLITDIGVPHTTAGTDSYPRDLPSMPRSKTRKDMDGPVPFNAITGQINKYQR